MPGGVARLIWGGLSALCMGFAKTGVPGASILAVVLMAQAFHENAALSVGALMPVILVGDLFAVGLYARDTAWDRLWRLLPSVLLGLATGAVLLHYVRGNALRPILGGLVLGMFLLEIHRRYRSDGRFVHTGWFAWLAGGLAGFATMVGNAAGPVMSMYLLSQDLPKSRFMGTTAVFYFIVNILKTVPMVANQMITRETCEFALFAVPVTLAGVALGRWVFRRISQAVFDSAALILAAIGGVWLIAG